MNTIATLTFDQAERALPELVALLRDVVDSGASVGFLPPLGGDEALAYWRKALADVADGSRVLLAARDARGALVGAVQLGMEMRANGSHRAEVQKLMVHTAARRQGLGRALMDSVEQAARAQGRTLLVLDTRSGDAADLLYRQHGYSVAGVIPRYARSAAGTLDDTVFFFKELV